MSRECPYCKGTAKVKTNLSYSVDEKTVEGLNGWICEACGEILFDEASVLKIEGKVL